MDDGEGCLLAAGAVVALVWGGYELFKWWSDADCYYYETSEHALCVTASKPETPCITYGQSYRYPNIACFDTEGPGAIHEGAGKAAEFVKNSGKKICGQFQLEVSCP